MNYGIKNIEGRRFNIRGKKWIARTTRKTSCEGCNLNDDGLDCPHIMINICSDNDDSADSFQLRELTEVTK